MGYMVVLTYTGAVMEHGSYGTMVANHLYPAPEDLMVSILSNNRIQ